MYLLKDFNGHVFYVGKGTGGRARQHITEVKSDLAFIEARHPGENRKYWGSGKNERIAEILKAGHDVLIEIDSLHETDESARKREAFLIFEYGTVTKKTGCLLNVTVEKVKRWKRIKGNLWEYK